MAVGGVHITPDLVDAVRDAIDIVDIAREHTELKRAGRGYQGLCPLHQEKTPSFSVDPDQNLFYCFGCGRGGDAIRLHMLMSADDFPSAIERLAMRYGIPLPAATPSQQKARDSGRKIELALEKALEFYRHALAADAQVQQYLQERQIASELIDRFQIGFAPDSWTALVDHLAKDVPEKDLMEAGLIARSNNSQRLYDRFRNRIIFPIHNAAGRLVGFGGRTLDPEEKAKYVNSSETASFRKRHLLYGLHLAKRAIREREAVVLVEGYFDVVGSVAAGVENVVAGMGTSLTPEQVKLIRRHSEEVILAYDGDEAGIQAGHKALPILLSEGLSVRTVSLASGIDPDTWRLEHGSESWQQKVRSSEDAVWLEMERLAPEGAAWNPQAQAKAVRSIGEVLATIPDAVARQAYSRRFEGRLGLQPGTLTARLTSRATRTGKATTGSWEDSGQAVPQIADTEIKVLRWLLTAEVIPPAEELLEVEVFRDPQMRNIYTHFLRLYQQTGVSPSGDEVRGSLPDESESVDLLARILVKRAATCSETEAFAALGRLDLAGYALVGWFCRRRSIALRKKATLVNWIG